MYENENQSFDNREQDYHYTNTPEQQAPTRPRKKNTNAARIAKKAGRQGHMVPAVRLILFFCAYAV